MENGSEILTRNNSNILKNINNFNSTSSFFHHKKLKLRNEMISSPLKANDTLNSGDFSLNLKQISNNIKNISHNVAIKNNLNFKSVKPNNNLIKLNDIINTNDKKIISRNLNHFNFLSQISSKNFTKFSSERYKKIKIFIERLTHSQSNLMLQINNHKKINQEIINGSISDLNRKKNKMPKLIDKDTYSIQNLKRFSITNNNFQINVNDKRINMPSLLSSPSNSSGKNKEDILQINKKNNFISDLKNIIQNNNKINTNNNDKNEINVFEKRMKNNARDNIQKKNNEIKTKLFFENKRKSNNFSFDNCLKNNIEQEYFNIKLKCKNSSNQSLCKFDNKINIFLESKSVLILNDNNSFKKELDYNSNIEKKEENTNDNKAKFDRLNRLKKSSIKGIKSNNRIVINDINDKKEEKNKNINENKNKFERSSIKKIQTEFLMEKRKSKKDLIKKNDKSKTAINKGIEKFSYYKIKKSKLHLILFRKKMKYIYSKHKFLKKNNKIIYNKTIYKTTYIRKAKMLLNIQDKLNNIVNIEKNKLKFPEVWNEENDKKFFENVIFNSEINEFNFKSKKIFKCNINIDLNNYIRTTINFAPFSNELKLVKFIKDDFFQNKRQKLKRKTFRHATVQGISLLNKEYEKKKEEKFIITKSKIRYSEDFDWIYSPINLLSIQKIILRDNNYYYSGEKNILSKLRKMSTIKRFSLKFNEENNKTIKRKLSLDKKEANKYFSNLKKYIKLQLKEFSILNQKLFFKRAKTKKKKINEVFSLNNNLSESMSESVNLEDAYLELLINVIEGKNRQFVVCFEKNKQFIDLNQKLIKGNTLLITSVKEGNIAIAKFLCDQGIDVNIQNNSGNTALHYALGGHFYNIADILKKYGAREDIKNNLGLFPWDCIENNFE